MNRNKIILSAGLTFVVLSGLSAFSVLYTKSNTAIEQNQNIYQVPQEPSSTNQNITNTTTAGPVVPTYQCDENGNCISSTTLQFGEDMSITAVKYTDLPSSLFSENFSWQTPEKISNLGVIVNAYSECDGPGCAWYSEKNTGYFRVANFTYQGQKGDVVLLPISLFSFSGANFNEYYFVRFNNSVVLLEQNSTHLANLDGLNKLNFLVNKTVSLPKNSNPTKILKIPGKQTLYLEEETGTSLFIGDLQVGGIKREKVAYFENKDIWNCGDFFVTFTNNIEGIQPIKYNIKLPKIFNLTNGQKENVADYDSTRNTGCGGRSGVNVLTEVNENDLEKIGTADDGNTIFRYKNDDYTESYKNYIGYLEATGASSSIITYEKFVSENPFIVMKDGFGRYIGFEKSKFLVNLAECGKPVIYLYPKTETKINVQVNPNGGLTKVDPFYPTDGWLVNAKPNGDLTDLSDKQQYPYLFWEGNAYDMEVPTNGFVLKKENIKRDMTKLLARLGLNEKETADFLEFWQVKLEEKPYVFVTFVSQTDFDKVAPLNISPRPDKVIRVFMDYQPLDLPITVRPLKIETPVRTGFTVVEWGGRLHQ